MMVAIGTACENVPADLTDQPVLDEGNMSAVRGSLAAGNGLAISSSSASLRGPVPHTTTACPAVRNIRRQHVIYVNYNMEGKVGDGECR